MNHNLTKKNARQSGFTIIEVLIVLAIVGLILLIVFLAVPVLQRNNRNTQRKSDVLALGTGINEYMLNNNYTFPPTCFNHTNLTNICADYSSSWLRGIKLSIIDPQNVAFVVIESSPTATAAEPFCKDTPCKMYFKHL